MKTIAILATLDTKAAEANFMRREIESLGGRALLIDLSVLGDASVEADVSKAEVMEAGGSSLEAMLDAPSREKASPVMVAQMRHRRRAAAAS